MQADINHSIWRRSSFDAIICDPPYGRSSYHTALCSICANAGGRARARTLGDRNGVNQVPVEHQQSHVPQTTVISYDVIISTLLNAADNALIPGGTLVFWLPKRCFVEAAMHPCLYLVTVDVSVFRWSCHHIRT